MKKDNGETNLRVVDEEGRPVNPYIPTFISAVPWYAAGGEEEEEEKKKPKNDYDEKRDHWAKFDVSQHRTVVNDRLDSKPTESSEPMADERARTVVRNLRIREDTAKYLHNIQADLTDYNPKTRSLKARNVGDATESLFVEAEESFVPAGKDGERAVFAWQTEERARQAGLLKRRQEMESEAVGDVQKEKVVSKELAAKYGVAKKTGPVIAESDVYVEYTASGQISRIQRKN